MRTCLVFAVVSLLLTVIGLFGCGGGQLGLGIRCCGGIILRTKAFVIFILGASILGFGLRCVSCTLL